MLVGVVDPNGADALPDPHYTPPWFTVDELLRTLAEQDLGDSQWTAEMAQAALANVQDRGDMISTTALTAGCPRSEIIARREDYVGDLNELWAALRGTMIHRSLELASIPGGIAELRLFTHVDGIELSGQPDLFTTYELTDYKVPSDQRSIPMQYLYSNQTEQLMINAFLVRHAERWLLGEDERPELPFDPRDANIQRVGIVFIGPQRPKVIVSKRSEEVIGKNGRPKKVRVPYVWDDAECLEVIRPRLHLFKNALDAYPDWPAPYTDPDTGDIHRAEEIWGGDKTWACPGYPECKFATCLAKRSKYVW